MILTAQTGLADALNAPGAGAFVAAIVIVVVAAACFIGAMVSQRRRLSHEVRTIVQALEELRSGRAGGRPEVDRASPLAHVADAVQRLGLDLHASRTDAETAAERWRALTDATHDTAIVTTDTDGDIRSFSAGASEALGWDENDVLSRPAAVLFEENAYKELLPKLARRSLRTQGVTTRSKLVRKDGSEFEAEIAVRLLHGAASQPVGFMMILRDITEQLRVETELRDSERRYRGLVEGLAEGVMIVKQGRLVYVNPAAEALCGRPAAELLGSPWRDRIATEDVLVLEATLLEIESGRGRGGTLSCGLIGPDGAPGVEVRIKATPVDFAGGPAVLLLAQDETVERRIERELRRNEARLDAVLESASDGILVFTESSDAPGDAVVQMTNRAFARMVGIPIAELLGLRESRLLQRLRQRAGGVEAIAARISADPLSSPRETISLDGDGPQEIRVAVAPLAGHEGEPLGRIVVCRDLTEQRRSERELQAQADKLQLSKVELEQSHRELNEVNRRLESRGEELKQLNDELQRLDKMKSDLLGNVSHELQTPLVSIRGYTEMILKERLGPISEEQRKGLTLSLKNIDRLISMIENLLAFSRTDPGLRDLKLSRFDLRPLIDEVVELLGEKIADKQLQVEVEIEGGDFSVQGDRDRILQVFVNLLSNAVKFSRSAERVRVVANPGQAGFATVRVIDSGVGIPPEALGRIFDRHFRAHPAPGGAEGSGIGLSIVRDILRLHGCTIGAESREGQGAEFTFTLPLSESSEDAPPDDDANPSAPSSRTLRPRLKIIRRHDKSEG